MVGVAQLVEHRVVVAVAAGSSPVTHPSQGPGLRSGALVMCGNGQDSIVWRTMVNFRRETFQPAPVRTSSSA